MTKEVIKGKDVTDILTMSWEFDHNHVWISLTNQRRYRMDVREFLKIIKDVEFTLSKKRVHTYLEIIEEKDSTIIKWQ